MDAKGLRMVVVHCGLKHNITGFVRYRRTSLIFITWFLAVCCGATAVNIPMIIPKPEWALADSAEAKKLEYQLKAAFLYNFMKFIERTENPSKAPAEEAKTKEPIILGVLGEDFFGEHLDALAKKTIKDRPIRIVRLEGFEQYKKSSPQATVEQFLQEKREAIESCHLLFISQSEKPLLNEVITFMNEMRVLSVSNVPDFAFQGGVIEFVMEENKIRFDINVVSAERKGLKINSQLLQLARKVHKKPQ